MEKSEKNRLDYKSKKKEKDKTHIKGKSKKIKEQAKENNPHQLNILLNNEVPIKKNQSNQNQKKQNLPLQDTASYNQMQMQRQNMIDDLQSYQNQVIMINQGVETPPASSIINQQNDSKIRFSSKSQEIICPYCHKNVRTTIEEEFNCISCIIYSLSFIFPPLFLYFMVCTNIEVCKCQFSCEKTSCHICYSKCGCFYYLSCCSCPQSDDNGQCCFCDIEHYCPNCGKLIGRRDSFHICPPCCNCCCCC